MPRLIKFLVSEALAISAGGIGSLATVSNIPTWYAALEKPFFNPPNWLFGPVWTVLYLLVGWSLYLVWTTPYEGSKNRAYLLFGAQLALNALWSLVFFGLHAPWAAVLIIVILLAGILMTIKLFWSISRLAAYLMLPYAAWVSFATVLNISVAILN